MGSGLTSGSGSGSGVGSGLAQSAVESARGVPAFLRGGVSNVAPPFISRSSVMSHG